MSLGISKSYWISCTLLLSAVCLLATAQNRSPFSPGGGQNRGRGGGGGGGGSPQRPQNSERSSAAVPAPSRQQSEGDGDNNAVEVVRSPFSPPPFIITPAPGRRPSQRRTSSPPPAARPTVSAATEAKSRGPVQSRSPRSEEGSSTDAPWSGESPFSPPSGTEWREGQRVRPPATRDQEPVQQANPPSNRKRGNARSQRRGRVQGSPRVRVYQEANAPTRDMHESAPGVTPWTRYTPKPRVRGQESNGNSRSARARCGVQSYSPRSQICCQGNVQRRQGMKPSCCGGKSYDTVFNKCCSGIVSLRTAQQPDCA